MEYPTDFGRNAKLKLKMKPLGGNGRNVLLQPLHIRIDAVHLSGNVDALRTMGHAPLAADAMVGLAQLRHAAVIPDEERTAGFAVILILRFGHISLVDAFVVMGKYGRYVDTKRTRHTVLAIIARNGRVLHEQIRRMM